jgi:tetratricopeptide (TPR) repeat protein
MTKSFIVLLFLGGLVACTSPEEKAANYIQNGTALLGEGNLDKAAIEFKNALQINQNLPDALFGLATIQESKQNWKEVYGILSKIREMAPGHVDARIKLAQLYLASNQLDQALEDANEILTLAPEDARSHSLMAAVQYRLENFDGAQKEVDETLAIDANNVEALMVRARVLMAEKRYDEALDELESAIEVHPDNVSLYLLKIQAYSETDDSQAIEDVYRALIAQFPENVSFKEALAQRYLEDENVDSAERILQQIVDSLPDSVDHKLRLVAFKRQYRSPDEAITLLKSYMAGDEDEYRYRLQFGEIYESSNQSEKAIDVYESIVKDDGVQSNGLEARNRLALLELRADHLERARELVNEVLTQDKTNENALLLQTSFHLSDKKYDEALVTARTVLRDNPDSIKAMVMLAQAYEGKGSNDLATESYTSAFQLNPGNSLVANKLATNLLGQRKSTQADEILLKSFASGNRSVDALKLMIQVKLALGEWDKAEQFSGYLENIEGQEAVAQQFLGVAYEGQEKREASIAAFKRAHELAPESWQPVAALVKSYLRNGEPGKARDFLHSILAKDNNNVAAHLLLGQLNLAEGATDEAKGHFNAIIDSNPELEAGYQRLAALYVSQNKPEKAAEVIRKGQEKIPDSPMLSMEMANIYQKQGEIEKAIEIYETLIEKNSDLLVAKNNLASLLTDSRGDPASLERARTVAADLRTSQVPQFRDTYAWASVVAGTNLEGAIEILEGIVRETPKVDIYNYHLGEAYRRKGDSENAIAYLKKAVELAAPESDVADKARQSLQTIELQ